MQQAILKFRNLGTGINLKKLKKSHSLQKRVLHTIGISLGLLSIFYVFFLASMVLNIIERKNLEANAKSLTNDISDLELAYLSNSSKIDLAMSASLGYKETKAHFATRKTVGLGTTTKGNNFSSMKIAKNEI